MIRLRHFFADIFELLIPLAIIIVLVLAVAGIIYLAIGLAMAPWQTFPGL